MQTSKGENLGLALVIEFDTIDIARKFYESEKYQEAKAVRELASNTHLVLVEDLKIQKIFYFVEYIPQHSS